MSGINRSRQALDTLDRLRVVADLPSLIETAISAYGGPMPVEKLYEVLRLHSSRDAVRSTLLTMNGDELIVLRMGGRRACVKLLPK